MKILPLLPTLGLLLASRLPADSPRWSGLWTSSAELARVPMAGPAWDAVLKRAAEDQTKPDLSDQNDPTDIRVLASAIAYARTGNPKYQNNVSSALSLLVRRGDPKGRTLAWARKSGAYALAADLAGRREPELCAWFLAVAETYVGSEHRTLLAMFKERPNNWGTQAFGSLTAIYAFLGDERRLQEVRSWYLGGIDGTNPGYRYGADLSWQADPNHPRIINAAGTVKQGVAMDGLEPEELRRGAPFSDPPKFTNYAWEGLQGHIMAARILERIGLPIWQAGDRAIYRAAYRLQIGFAQRYGPQWAATGDDEWMLPFLDEAYGSHWSAGQSRLWDAGKNAGFGYVIAGDRHP